MDIRRELPVPPIQPTLDDVPYQLSDDELAFLKQTVSPDPGEIKRRAEIVRKEAYEHYPYPCIRRFHFLNLMMLFNPIYPAVVEAGRKGNTWFLDIGCCSMCNHLFVESIIPEMFSVGTDVRKLVIDGYHASNVAACDLRSAFIDIGKDNCEITLFTADIFELSLSRQDGINTKPTLLETAADTLSSGGTNNFGLESLKGCLSHVYTGALFHLFDEETQYALALRVALLLNLKPRGDDVPPPTNCVIFGRHQGQEDAGVMDDDMGRIRYGHNAETWTRMWQRAFTELEGEVFASERVRVQAEFVQNHVGRPGHKWFVWTVFVVYK